jgi:Xaa-Pro aminopeptidase
MTARLPTPFHLRQQFIRAALRDASLDALVVTHLPNVQYLCGFRGTAGVLVVGHSRCTLLVDFRYLTAARSLLESHPELSAIEVAVVERSYDDRLAEVLQQGGWSRIGIEAAHMPVNRFNRLSGSIAAGSAGPLERRGPSAVLVPTERMVERARVIKDTVEIGLLREGARRLSAVAREARGFVRPGRTELEIAGDIDAALRRAGFERPAFETIVAAGPHGALPHARPGGSVVAAGEGVVLDFGGVYDGYCVDLTRTVQVGARPADLARIFAAVQVAHAAAVKAVRPGVLASEVDAAARGVLTAAGLGDAFGHGTGHGLGLEVHEEPRIARRAPDQPDPVLAAGMVFTIEPGAYVPGTGGVRIEDDVLVVADGCEVLTDVPIDL